MEKFIKISTTSTGSVINSQRRWDRLNTDYIVNTSHIVNIHVYSKSIWMIDNTGFALTEESFNKLLDIIELV